MYTDAQRLLDHRSAPATALTGAAWVNLDIRPTSIFRFVARIGGELIPRCISNAFRQTVVLDHPCDAQILKDNQAKTVDQFSAFLVSKVLAPVRYSLMDAGNNLASPRSFWRSFRLFAQAALRSCEIFFATTKKAGVINRLTSRERSKLLQPDIHAYGGWWHIGNLSALLFHRERDKPLAGTTTPQRDGFDAAFDGAVKVDRYLADLGEDELVPFEPCAVAVLWIGHTVVATKALKSRVSGVLFARPNTAKECLECQIDTNLNVLQDLAMHQPERLAFGFPVGKHRLGVVQPKRFLALLPGVASGRKRLIVDPAAFLKLLLKEALLAFRQMQPVLICRFTQVAHTVNYNVISDRTQVLSVRASAFHWLSRTAFIPGLKARGFLPPFL